MDQHTIDAELSQEGARELLASSETAHLSYVATDGSPRVVPVGFFWTGTEFVLATATTAPKVVHLRERPDVALSLDGGNTPGRARCLSVRGRAETTVVDGVVPEYLAAARETMDAAAFEQFAQACRDLYPRMVRIAIRPRWVRFYDYGAGRVPRFLRELAEATGS